VLREEKDVDHKAGVDHFERLFQCYGDEICVLNLVKNTDKSTETTLGNAYKKFVDFFVNKLRTQHSTRKIRFRWIDFLSLYSKNDRSLIRDLQIYGRGILESISLFRYGMFDGILTRQKGVIRVNCIDCLDRTNNAMACIASVVFAKILNEIDAEVKNLVDENTGGVKNELLSIVFELFGVT